MGIRSFGDGTFGNFEGCGLKVKFCEGCGLLRSFMVVIDGEEDE
jgi:hypothetical protein